MTNRDRDSVAKLLLGVADRLKQAPDLALENATRNAASNPSAYQVGYLESACGQAQNEIRMFVEKYLTARAPKERTARGRR